MAVIATDKLGGSEVEIHCSASGMFSVYTKPEYAREPTEKGTPPVSTIASGDFITSGSDLGAVKKRARQLLRQRQTRVAVPFKTLQGYDAIAKGFHRSQRDKILVWIDDPAPQYKGRGRNEHMVRWSRREILKPDTTLKDLKERDRLVALATRVNNLITKWRDKHTFDLFQAVQDALIEAEKETQPKHDQLYSIPVKDRLPTDR